MKEEQARERRDSEAEGEEDEDLDDDELDFADIGSLSIINEYRAKNEKLAKELQERETKLRLLQNE